MGSCDNILDFQAKAKCWQNQNNSFSMGLSTGATGATATSTMPGQEKSSFWTWDNVGKLTNSLTGLAQAGVSVWSGIENVNLQKKLAESQINQGKQSYTSISVPQGMQAPQAPSAAQAAAMQNRGAQMAALESFNSTQDKGTDTKKIAMIALVGIGGLMAVVLVTKLIGKNGNVAN